MEAQRRQERPPVFEHLADGTEQCGPMRPCRSERTLAIASNPYRLRFQRLMVAARHAMAEISGVPV